MVLLLASGGSYQHDYYSLPLLLPAAVFVAKVFDRKWARRKGLLACLLVLTLVLSGYRHLGTLAEERQRGTEQTVADLLLSHTEPGDLIVSCNASNPVWLYLAQRRGWGRDCSAIDRAELDRLLEKGARYLVAGRSDSVGSGISENLDRSLGIFFETRQVDDIVLASLARPRRVEALTWQTTFREDFADSDALDSWQLNGGVWTIEQETLVGTRMLRPAEVVTRDGLPACGICRVRFSLTLIHPSSAETVPGEEVQQRGAGRRASLVMIRLWWQDDGSGILLSLATRGGSLGLQQFVRNERIHSSHVDFDWQEGEPYAIELRSDGFEFELLVNGESILETANHLPALSVGRLSFRSRLGSLRIDDVEIQEAWGGPDAPDSSGGGG